MSLRPGRTRRRSTGLPTRTLALTFSEPDALWLEALSAARMCSMSQVLADAIACYQAALDREQELVEREEKAARKRESKALEEEDVEP